MTEALLKSVTGDKYCIRTESFRVNFLSIVLDTPILTLLTHSHTLFPLQFILLKPFIQVATTNYISVTHRWCKMLPTILLIITRISVASGLPHIHTYSSISNIWMTFIHKFTLSLSPRKELYIFSCTVLFFSRYGTKMRLYQKTNSTRHIGFRSDTQHLSLLALLTLIVG